jgi:hypothetical protein
VVPDAFPIERADRMEGSLKVAPRPMAVLAAACIDSTGTGTAMVGMAEASA